PRCTWVIPRTAKGLAGGRYRAWYGSAGNSSGALACRVGNPFFRCAPLSSWWHDPLHVFSVARAASSTSGGGSCRYTSSPSTFTAKTCTEYDSPLRHCPDSSEKVFLWTGQATFGLPPWSPIMPRARTNSRRCGHMFCVAYHSPRLAKLKTATCVLPCLTATPPSRGKSHTLPTTIQSYSGSGRASTVSGCSSAAPAPRSVNSLTGMNDVLQALGRCCSRCLTNSMVGSVSWVLTNCLNRRRFCGSLTTSFHSHL